jgi:1-acylglycerone phosphate reductase
MKSVLITGCSDGGIGSALALTFTSRGFLVFACARTPSKMSALSNLPNVHLLTLDILAPSDISAAVSFVRKTTGGGLDYLVNNAAQARYMPLLDEDVAQAKELFELNVWAQLRMVQGFADALIEAKGCAVYISSLSGHLNLPWNGMYKTQLTLLIKYTQVFGARWPTLTMMIQEHMQCPNARRKSCSTR